MPLRVAERAAAVAAVWVAAQLARSVSGLPLKEHQAPQDKSDYSLFNPTPLTLMRELTTDRPDKTESPYTVDAGHYQIELDFLSYSHDRDHGQTVDTFAIAPTNFKVGLLNNVDLQVIAETYNIEPINDRAARRSDTMSGYGDTLVRLKTNFWGNDGGDTAFGVIPFVKLPTNQHDLGNHAVEGGVIFPFAVKLPHEFDLGAETAVSFVQNENSSDYHEEFVNSITVGHGIIGKLSGYAEFFSSLSTERDAEWIGTFDFGFTYALTPNVQLDAGMNVGLTRSADDLNPFVGFSIRY
ncbi:MAG: transporter [Chthoniobacterales bacterium]